MTKDGLFPSMKDISTQNDENQTISSITQSINSDVSNLKINTITNNSATITWSGNPNAQTWVHVYEPYNVTGHKNSANDNHFTYSTLAANTSFTVYVQGAGSEVVLQKNFKTQNNTQVQDTPTVENPVQNNTNPQDTPTAQTPVENQISQPVVNNEAPNSYLEEVNLPKCDANNPEVFFIKTNADWSHINDTNKRIFCVSPSDYSTLKNIKLTTSGTSEKRRYIILNNGNDLHPGKLNKDQLANIALELIDANYWIIDRMASFNVGFSHSFIVNRNSSHNIFNRLLTKNIFHTMWIKNNANFNTIQNSRFDGITRNGTLADLATINIVEYYSEIPFTVYGTKVINNEFINVKGLRLNSFEKPNTNFKEGQEKHFDGTIFYNNTVEYTSDIRTDCKGNLNPKGSCMLGEAAAMAMKGGSSNPNNPILIQNNKVWGYRKSDNSSNPHSGSVGYGFLAYMNTENMYMSNNIIFDGTAGIVISDRYWEPQGTLNATIVNNIIVNCGQRPNTPKEF
ncbi:MAG TPA: hypothetical protein ENK99_01750, partial [Campylobacterales bacterium]|nr:hypothetical protein [Campylobacterales bacterium]